MKKIFCSLFISFCLFGMLFANENLFSFTVGLSSGMPFYGEDSEEIDFETKNRAIVGTYGTVNLNIIKQVTFYTGADLLADFNWESKDYFHHLHVGFPLGVKIYPGLAGFNLGLAYTLGFRNDVYRVEDIKDNYLSPWGNGFKLTMEYDFAHDGSSNYLPTIGISWNIMPRGNYNYDNLLVFYIGENF